MNNTVPPGYKQTEVGVIPVDWEIKRLGEVAMIATGNTPPTKDISNYGDEFFFVGPVDMGDTKFISKTEKMLSKKGFAMSRRFPKDSILFVSIGSTIGKCGIAPVELTSNQQINAIFPSTNFSSDYLFYAISSAAQRIRSQAGEQAVPIVNKTQFSKTTVAFPPLLEQRAIAEALSDVDGLLAGLDRLITKKRDLKQAAMQQLLTGQTRLPGFHGEWEVKRLGEGIADLVAGVSVNSVVGDLDGSGMNNAILKTSAVSGGIFKPTEAKVISSTDLQRVTLSPLADTVLISRMNTIELVGECGYVPADFPSLFIPDRLWMTRFRPDGILNAKWLSLVLCTSSARMLVRNIASGTSGSMKNISKPAFLNLEFATPPLPEQTAIAEVLTDMDAELAALEGRRDKTSALKQAMMQELLTGRTRLIAPYEPVGQGDSSVASPQPL